MIICCVWIGPDEAGCVFCVHHQHGHNESVIASYSFKCHIPSSEDEPQPLQHFNVVFSQKQPNYEQNVDEMLDTYEHSLPFKTCTDSMWNNMAIGMNIKASNCLSWKIGDSNNCVIHVFCRTPSTRGSLRWINSDGDGDGHGYLGLEGAAKYSLHVISLRQPSPLCHIEPKLRGHTITELRITSPTGIGTPTIPTKYVSQW